MLLQNQTRKKNKKLVSQKSKGQSEKLKTKKLVTFKSHRSKTNKIKKNQQPKKKEKKTLKGKQKTTSYKPPLFLCLLFGLNKSKNKLNKKLKLNDITYQIPFVNKNFFFTKTCCEYDYNHQS